MTYQSCSKYEFEKFLCSVAGVGKILSWKEASDELATHENPIWEYVYRFRLRNPSVNIVIYSSIDKRSQTTRSCGADAVRLIYEWRTKRGVVYRKIAKRNRVEGLFENLQLSLVGGSEKCFKLDFSEFGSLDKALS